MLHKVLCAKPDVEMHHEYAVQVTQPLAVKRYLGLIGEADARAAIAESFGAAVHYSQARLWGDSSNKLSWLIADLAALFPAARFVHLVRDGRKVASSYFHKLGAENYDDRSNAILQAHYDGFSSTPSPLRIASAAMGPSPISAQSAHGGGVPPPEKPYWWPVPRRDDPMAGAFRGFDQFQRICWHWAEINRVILASLAALPPERTLFARLEDLVQSPSQVRGLLEFLDLDYQDSDFAAFARPHNVNRPQDHLLTDFQRGQFDTIAAPMMARLGYSGRAEYAVNY